MPTSFRVHINLGGSVFRALVVCPLVILRGCQEASDIMTVFWIIVGGFVIAAVASQLRQGAFERRLDRTVAELKDIHYRSKQGRATLKDLEDFKKISEECSMMIASKEDKQWTNSIYRTYPTLIQQMYTETYATFQSTAKITDEIVQLANLRKQGVISGEEFKAFSERFCVSPGERARDFLSAIAELHQQRKNGALTEGLYHSALWGLLDKLDRKIL